MSETREVGFYWVLCFRNDLQVASWDGQNWHFCGAESIGYAEPDDPTEDRVKVMSERLIPPVEDVDAQLKSIGAQITESEASRNNVEFDKLGDHIGGLFGALSTLSKK